MTVFQSPNCIVDHQDGPGQDYWYIGDRCDGYGAPHWPTREAMIEDLRRALIMLETGGSFIILDEGALDPGDGPWDTPPENVDSP